jgi:putative membrane protein
MFILVTAIVMEQFVISKSMTRDEMKKITKIDTIYGISFILVVISGLLLWFVVGKPAPFYTRNWIFHTKLTLLVAIALLSIYPTVFFLRNRKGDDLDTIIEVPARLITLVRLELILLIGVPLLASFMSLGIGSF